MILMIDNYDSFTYNLVQLFGEMGQAVTVFRNDQVTIEEMKAFNPTQIVISPGPEDVDQAGVSLRAIESFAGKVPILGVGLGHQAIARAFGGKIIRVQKLEHGRTSLVYHDGRSMFAGLPSPFAATRYHSLMVDRDSLPDCLEISAWTEEGEIMGLRHKQSIVEGAQFHPESIMTDHGRQLLENFISLRVTKG